MLDRDSYIEGLLIEIEILKAKGRHSLYRINDEIPEDIAFYVEEYFANKTSYKVNVKKCLLYENSYDIMITFKAN